ncbi:MAG: hypothetical protein HC905_01575 [Bacteroidales bacterium]|nr:hypothetical protein [Bacteroidales bacterium]
MLQLTRQHGNFGYSLGVNGIYTTSRIEERIEPAYPNDYQYRAGHPIGQFFGLEANGFLTQEDIDNPQTPTYTFIQVRPGDVKYVDQNLDGLIDSNDEIAIGGTSAPTLYYGINFGFQYRSISINGLFQGMGGKEIQINSLSGPIGKQAQISEYVMNRWTPDNQAMLNIQDSPPSTTPIITGLAHYGCARAIISN